MAAIDMHNPAATVLGVLRESPDLDTLARAIWEDSKEDKVIPARGKRPERTRHTIGRWTCPHCGAIGTPTYGGYTIWAGGEESPEGPGLYMSVLAQCPWTMDRLAHINSHRANGKRQRYWRPYHATMAPCGESYEFTTRRIL